jgi:hypothetical protein
MRLAPSIGLTTGCMYKTISPFSPEIINLCRQVSLDAIEINCVGGFAQNGMPASRIIIEELDGFKHRSLHAPCANGFSYGNNEATKNTLRNIADICDRLNISLVVFHPDTIYSWELFKNLPFNWAIENMDYRKIKGVYPQDLQEIFNQLDCGFVLDLNHCYSVDKSMYLATRLIEKFQNRIKEIHLSGFTAYHEPLYQTKQYEEIIKFLPDLDVPIILEAVFNSAEEAYLEYNYVYQSLF